VRSRATVASAFRARSPTGPGSRTERSTTTSPARATSSSRFSRSARRSGSRHLRATLKAGSGAGEAEAGLDAEARDATRSLKESREWRLLLFEFVAHAARTPALAPKLREQKRKFREALAEVLDERLSDRAHSIPVDELALAAMALANGLAFEEVADPGAVPDELLGKLLAALLASGARYEGNTR
jgi:hypothetical protein